MTIAAVWHYIYSWLRSLASIKALGALLSAFGALWLTVEITAFFLDGTTWPNKIRAAWKWFGIAGIVTAIWFCRPPRTVGHKLNGRDVTIHILLVTCFRCPVL